jgi:GNAT superfamily N-acetyltransferase
MGQVTVRALGAGDWSLVAELFGARGACGGCWCMWWRVARGGREWELRKGARNRDALRAAIEAGQVHAVVALADGEPVGWCSLGPRGDFPRLENSRVLRSEPVPGLWSVVCFFVPTPWRRSGVARALLAGAVELARDAGASALEAYPVVPKGTPVPAAFAWTGVPSLFERAGFVHQRRPDETRPIYRLRLRRDAEAGVEGPGAAPRPAK